MNTSEKAIRNDEYLHRIWKTKKKYTW